MASPMLSLYRRPLALAAACLVPLVIAAVATAQEDQTARRAGTVDIPLAERSRIFVNAPNNDTNEIYEGFLAIHFPLGGSMQDGYDRARLHDRAAWTWLPSFSMVTNLRQLRAESAPVRSPSYMPRLRVTAARTAGIPESFGNTWTRQWVFDATLGHYSNGQEGCLFAQQQDTGDDECRLPPGIDDGNLVVIRGGSFSSHYLEGGAAYRWLRWNDVPVGNSRGVAGSVVGVFARYRDYEALSGWPGGMDPDLRRLYGSRRVRIGIDLSLEDLWTAPRGPVWAHAWAELSNGEAPAAEGVRFAVEVGKTFDVLNGTGLFARYYDGHDDYNAAFLTPLRVLQIGVSLGGERRASVRP